MDIDGDIKVWTDGDKVCARLHADSPEGPIVVQASAPLAPIRQRVVRALARRGVTISGDEPGYGATIESIARKKALKRLRLMAPRAFSKRGLASFIARGELMKRRRRRNALARAGQPVGAKAIGPVPSAGPQQRKRRRRWRGLGRLARPLIPAALATTSAALTPFLTRRSARSLPPVPPAPPKASGSPSSGQGVADNGSPSGGSSSDASDSAADQEPADDKEERVAAGSSNAEESSQADANEDGADENGAGNGDEGDGDEAEGDGDGNEADGNEDGGDDAKVGAELGAPVTRHHVRQALVLLHAARRHPRARRRVHRIVQMAGLGEPSAKKALTALKVAKKIKAKANKSAPIKAKPKLALAPLVQPQKVLATPVAQPSPALAVIPTTSTTSSLRRWLDVFAPWRRGVG